MMTSPEAARAADPKKMDGAALAMLCVGHMLDDVNQGAIPAMLPYFIAAHDLSYSAAAGLVLAVTVSSSVLQPFLGQFSDRHSAPWLVPAGLFLAGAGVALSTLMPTYLLIALSIGLSGLGVAAFHPEAARFANLAAGARRATGMSVFSLGGNLGFAVGPLVTTALLLAFGLRGGLFLAIPATAMALLIAWQLPRFTARPRLSHGKGIAAASRGGDAWGPFLRLTGAVVTRSIVFFGLNTFIPLYWQDVLHQPTGAGGLALTVLFTAGAVGTLAGGWLSDRHGRRLVVLSAMAVLALGLVAFVLVQDVAMATLLLVPLGLALNAPSSVMVVMGQEYLPTRVGTASGVTLGLAVSVGGLAAPLLGHMADTYGIHAVLSLLAVLPVLAIGFAATLPRSMRT